MFTGIVTGVGKIAKVTPLEKSLELTVDVGHWGLSDVHIGDSIAVNGVCLTVLRYTDTTFSVEVSEETLRCTVGLGEGGRAVNLEKALTLNERLGGHLVTGHVDGVGVVTTWETRGESTYVEIDAPLELAKFIAQKGSITVNGVSLTVNSVEGRRFALNLISHTVKVTTFTTTDVGDRVNLEVDLMARYCERILSYQNAV
jgi:riboflavin synthase